MPPTKYKLIPFHVHLICRLKSLSKVINRQTENQEVSQSYGTLAKFLITENTVQYQTLSFMYDAATLLHVEQLPQLFVCPYLCTSGLWRGCCLKSVTPHCACVNSINLFRKLMYIASDKIKIVSKDLTKRLHKKSTSYCQNMQCEEKFHLHMFNI